MTTPNFEALKQRRAGSSRGFGWKAKENANKVRILPPHSKFIGNWDQMTDLAVTFRIHYFKIEGKQTEVSRCLDELKQQCPACAMSRAHRKSTDPGLQELAKSIRASDQYLFNILDINNLQAGIQAWGANYTCWDKIMEIAANPAWGCVVDPANGVNFEVTMTPGNRSRSGHNAYSVTPEPQRTTVMAILEAIEGWQEKLNTLPDHITPPKTAEEISGYLDDMGFPPITGSRPPGGGAPLPVNPAVQAIPVGGAPMAISIPGAPATAAPAPVSIPGSPMPAVAPASTTAPAPVTIPTGAPASIQIPSATPAPVPIPVQTGPQLVTDRPAAASIATATSIHYDPGPNYTPKVSDAERPVGAPRCFGDYAPTVHRCQPCPVLVDCQYKLLGIA